MSSSYRIANSLFVRQLGTTRCPALTSTQPKFNRTCRQYSEKSPGTTTKPKLNSGTNSTWKLALIGCSLGATSGTAYSLYTNWKDKNAHLEHERFPLKTINELPKDLRITKRFVNPKDTSGLEVILFQFQTCPFCCKVRAFLDYYGISYSVVEVDAVLRQDIKWSEEKKVPMVLVRRNDGRFLQICDSSAIISLLASYLNDKRADVGELAQYYPKISYFDDFGKKKRDILNKYFMMYQDHTPKGLTREMQEVERKWRTWADNHLVHLISPNCYQSLTEALETFEWFSQAGEWDIHFPKWERDLMVYVGTGAMWFIGKLLKKRHDLSDDVRSHIYAACEKWVNVLNKRKTKFLGGNEPNLADLSIFGVLSSMEGCKAFKDCLKNTDIGEWYYNVKGLVQKNRGELIRERIERNPNSNELTGSTSIA